MCFSVFLKFLPYGHLATRMLHVRAAEPGIGFKMPSKSLPQAPKRGCMAQNAPKRTHCGPNRAPGCPDMGPGWPPKHDTPPLEGAEKGFCRLSATLLTATWLPKPARQSARPQPEPHTIILVCCLDLPALKKRQKTLFFRCVF